MKAFKPLLALPLLLLMISCTSQEERDRRTCAELNMLNDGVKAAKALGITNLIEDKLSDNTDEQEKRRAFYNLAMLYCEAYGISR
jgi:hypothetical protein